MCCPDRPAGPTVHTARERPFSYFLGVGALARAQVRVGNKRAADRGWLMVGRCPDIWFRLKDGYQYMGGLLGLGMHIGVLVWLPQSGPY